MYLSSKSKRVVSDWQVSLPQDMPQGPVLFPHCGSFIHTGLPGGQRSEAAKAIVQESLSGQVWKVGALVLPPPIGQNSACGHIWKQGRLRKAVWLCVHAEEKRKTKKSWWTPIGLIKNFPDNDSRMFYHLKKKKAHWNSIMALLLHTKFLCVWWVYFWLSVWSQLSVSEPYCFCSYKFNFGSWNNNAHLTFIQSIYFVYLGNCKNLNYKQWQHTCLRGVFPAFAGSLHLIFTHLGPRLERSPRGWIRAVDFIANNGAPTCPISEGGTLPWVVLRYYL